MKARHQSAMHGPLRVRNMSRLAIPIASRQFLEQIALDIYTDMTAAGHSLHATVLAIYLSGINHAIGATE